MQMVAASKLRRAQGAAEAARPYADKMDAVISGIAAAASGSPGAPALLGGTGRDQVHLLLVCTGERGLCGAFNSAIVRLAREHAQNLINQGKEVKIFCVGRKGFDQLRRIFEKQIAVAMIGEVCEREGRSTAFHECAHAYVATKLGVGISKVTIVPEGRFLGHMAYAAFKPRTPDAKEETDTAATD